MNLTLKKKIARGIPLRIITSWGAPVLTYHACYRRPPAEVAHVDNVAPEWLYEQLSKLKKATRFVPVDELAECKDRRGVAAITFDDGYQSVVAEAMPVLVALDTPFTIFVSTFPLEGKTFWRHKVVDLINRGLAAECEAFLQGVQKITGQSFYSYLKDPHNNSRLVEQEIDRFYAYKGIQATIPQYLASKANDFVAHPLVWYGNHTHHHYVLASLSPGEQRDEVETTKRYLERIPGIQLSRSVALPFGRADQANAHTLRAVRETGYTVLLLNQGGANLQHKAAHNGLTLLDRFSVNESPIAWDVAKQFGGSILKGIWGRESSVLGERRMRTDDDSVFNNSSETGS